MNMYLWVANQFRNYGNKCLRFAGVHDAGSDFSLREWTCIVHAPTIWIIVVAMSRTLRLVYCSRWHVNLDGADLDNVETVTNVFTDAPLAFQGYQRFQRLMIIMREERNHTLIYMVWWIAITILLCLRHNINDVVNMYFGSEWLLLLNLSFYLIILGLAYLSFQCATYTTLILPEKRAKLTRVLPVPWLFISILFGRVERRCASDYYTDAMHPASAASSRR